MLEQTTMKEMKDGRKFGLAWGASQATINVLFATLYLACGEMYYKWNENELFSQENMFISMFCVMFGSFTAGQAIQFGPDIFKAKTAAIKIYNIIDRPSKIDVMGGD